MFMRISWGRVKSGQWEEYERRFDKLSGEQAAGWGPKRRWLVRDLDEPDAGFALSLFDTEGEMRAYSNDAAIRQRIQSEFGDLYVGDYRTRLCEVRRTIG